MNNGLLFFTGPLPCAPYSQDCMSPISFLYITAPSPEQALLIGRTLVEERLAACVNVVPGMRSVYWWEGVIEESAEAVLLVKCARASVEPAMTRVRQLHPYRIPCIAEIPIERCNPAYLDWLMRESAPA